MPFRNLVYTGLMRARKLAEYVGTRKALAMDVNRQNAVTWQTALSYLLKQGAVA